MYKKSLLVLIICIFALEAFFFSRANFELEQLFVKEEKNLEELRLSLAGLPITAKAVSIYDVKKMEKIFGKNDNLPLPIASLAKTMVIVSALSGQDNNKILNLSTDAIKQAGDFGLRPGEEWRTLDLAKMSMVASANDAVHMLGEGEDKLFLLKLNEKARKIGMENAMFFNFTGLDFETLNENLEPEMKVGAYASANDANLMAIYAIRAQPEAVGASTLPEIELNSLSGFTHKFKNTNLILDKIPNLVFSKTGFTELAGGNLTVIFGNKQGALFAVTVLGSTFEERFSDMEKIVEVLYNFDYASGSETLPKL